MSHRNGCPRLYTPAAPFVEAIDAWLVHQRRQMGVPICNPRGRTRHDGGSRLLTELTGINARAIRRWRTGEARYIELRNADRLALALDIPLPLLADDFRPMHGWFEVAA